MGGFSLWHILLLGLVAMVLFGGRGKISDFMGDFAKGIRSFRKGLAEEDPPQQPPRPLSNDRGEPVSNIHKDPAAH